MVITMILNLPELLKNQPKHKINLHFKPGKTSLRTELWYRNELLALVRKFRQVVESEDFFANEVNLNDGKFNDDASKDFDADRFLKAAEKLSKADIDGVAKKIAQGLLIRGNAQNIQEVEKDLKRQTRVDLQGYLHNSGKVAEKLEQLTTANVQLIKSIHSQYLDKIQAAVMQAQVKGTLTKDLAKQIQEIGGVTEKRAKLIARDQSAKINASLTRARHEEMGIKQYIWSTSGDERVRDSHAENDGKIFSYDDPPPTGHPGDEINCFPAQSKLKGLPRPEKFYRRWYSGKLTKLVTDNGTVLLATPNHPILTNKGIKPIDSVNVGDYLACEVQQTFDTVELNGKNLIPTVEQVFNALIFNGIGASVATSKSGKFHGDFSDSEIEIISIDSFLVDILNTLFVKKLPELGFSNSDMIICKALFSTDSHFDFFNSASRSSASCFMGRLDLICSLLIGHLTPLELFCLGLGANIGIIGKQVSTNDISRDLEMFSNHIFACAALIHGKDFIYWQRDRIMSTVTSNFGHRYADSFETLSKRLFVATNNGTHFGDTQSLGVEFRRVVNKVVTQASCHIYNLQTVSGYYNINSVLVSNCRCVAIPYFGDKVEQKAEEVEQSQEIERKQEELQFVEQMLGEEESNKARDRLNTASEFIKQHKLSQNEALSVIGYTGGFYKDFNKALRTGMATPKITRYENLLNKALEKLPKFNGISYRAVQKLSKEDLARYKEGEVVTEPFFVSTSELKKVQGFGGKVRFEIYGKNGRKVENLSLYPSEKEVLFKSNSHFFITKVSTKGLLWWKMTVIELLEV